MTSRQYFVTALFGLLLAVLFPRMPIEELMLKAGGQITVFPSAGREAWVGFNRINSESFVGDVTRSGRVVSYKLGIGNSLYKVTARCGSVMSVTSDPEGKADQSQVLASAKWVCAQYFDY